MRYQRAKTKTDELKAAIEAAGTGVTFVAEPVLEIEFDRHNETAFPSKYTICGLRIERDQSVSWSIEPMFKPREGDCYESSWSNGQEGIAQRRKILKFLRKLDPILQKLKLRRGQEVAAIHKLPEE